MGSSKSIVVVLCPYPAMGHIKPMIELARLISCPSQIIINDDVYTIKVELVCTEFYFQRIHQTWPNANLWGIRVHAIPDGLPSTFDRSVPSTKISKAIAKLGPIFESFLQQLIFHDGNVNVATKWLLIYDGFVSWAHDVATKLHIPRVLFWTQSASVLAIFSNLQHLISSGFNPFEGDGGGGGGAAAEEWCKRNVTDGIPASALPFRVAPEAGGGDRRFLLSESLASQRRQWRSVSCAIVHSIQATEPPGALRSLRSAIDPVQLKILGPLIGGDGDGGDLVEWLDRRPRGSVLYISLGSVVRWEEKKAMAVARIVVEMKQEFVWVMRPWGLVLGMEAEAMKLGRFVRWAPQEAVLRHPSIAAFFTHAGWNSTLETLAHGVPVLAWPHFLDQFTNAWLLSHHWRLGFLLRDQDLDLDQYLDQRHSLLFSLLLRLLRHGPDRLLFLSNASRLKSLASAAKDATASGEWRRELLAGAAGIGWSSPMPHA